MLNAVVPGLGNSRAGEGNATFTIKDSVIQTLHYLQANDWVLNRR